VLFPECRLIVWLQVVGGQVFVKLFSDDSFDHFRHKCQVGHWPKVGYVGSVDIEHEAVIAMNICLLN